MNKTSAELIDLCMVKIKEAVAEKDEQAQNQKLEIIRMQLDALPGIECPTDVGPWTVSEDGKTIQSDRFDHDACLQLSGDFWGPEARKTYALHIAHKLNGIPVREQKTYRPEGVQECIGPEPYYLNRFEQDHLNEMRKHLRPGAYVSLRCEQTGFGFIVMAKNGPIEVDITDYNRW